MDANEEAQCGLIGFFDVLGYKSLIENNQIGKVMSVVKKIQATLDEHQKYLTEWAEGCGHVMFSDSILVYAPFSGPETEHKNTGLQELLNCLLQLCHTDKGSAAHRLLRQLAKPPFHLIEPTGTGRYKVQSKSRMTF